MSMNERLFRIAILLCFLAAIVFYIANDRPMLSAIFGILFGTALERLVMSGQRMR
jgi:hypothetical protein